MTESLPRRIEESLAAHVRIASGLKRQAEQQGRLPVPFITMSRQFGCEAIVLAEALAQKLDETEKLEQGSWQVYSKQIIEAMADKEYSAAQLMEALDLKARTAIEEFIETIVGRISDLKLLNKLVRTLRATATLGRCIIIGRGGALLTRDMPGGIHIRLVAPEEFRLQGLVTRFQWSMAKAQQVLRQEDNIRLNFFKKYLHSNPNDAQNYDLVLNTERLSRAEQLDQILTLFKARNL
ncbi:cytidylate kinase-like family protein [bacterium]|nr:cytidylate kinase-like family protein [bacterium]MBU1636798.1 cytidylate kinase-like family protein [bacterium]